MKRRNQLISKRKMIAIDAEPIEGVELTLK